LALSNRSGVGVWAGEIDFKTCVSLTENKKGNTARCNMIEADQGINRRVDVHLCVRGCAILDSDLAIVSLAPRFHRV
jgi:hypothetical protein